MPNKEIAIEYTEDRYCSRSEASKILGFQMPDSMWKKITDYRANFFRPVNVKWFSNNTLNLCVCPTLASRLNNIEMKINRLHNDANKLDKINGSYQHFKLSCYKNALRELISKKNLDINEERLSKLIITENPFDDAEDYLINYLNALKFIEVKFVNPIDVDFLAELYSRVTGIPELTYFYRDSNISSINSTAIISRIYEGAQSTEIEEMMESLFTFIKTSNMSAMQKALVSYYYIITIKPFRDFNEEIAILTAKAVLANQSFGDFAALINVESLNNERNETIRKINTEVQQNNDVTYAINSYIIVLENSINETVNLLTDYSVRDLQNDFYKADEIVKPEIKESVKQDNKTQPKVDVEQISLFGDNEEIKEIEKPHKPKEENKKVVEVSKVEVSEKLETKPASLAINFIPQELDERTASRLAEHLLEMDVELKKGEAHFYARHCTLGMYYTIDQYKKATKCVYETARTSMEHLVKLGYYSKKQVGKKFVYTPVERK